MQKRKTMIIEGPLARVFVSMPDGAKDYILSLCDEVIKLNRESHDRKKAYDALMLKWDAAVDIAARYSIERDEWREMYEGREQDIANLKTEVKMLREDVERLTPLAVGGDGMTHFYWKDVAEAEMEASRKLKAQLKAIVGDE